MSRNPHPAAMILLVCLLLASSAFPAITAAQPAASSAAPLTNEDIVRMVQAGLPANVIVTVIKSSKAAFSLDTDSLIALTKAGVSGEVLRAMVNAAPEAKAAAATAAAAPAPARPPVAADPELSALCELPPGGGIPAWQSGAAPAVWSVRPGKTDRTEITSEHATISQVGFAGFSSRLLVLHPLNADVRIDRDSQFLSCINPKDAPLVHFSLDRRSHERNTSVGNTTPFNASLHISPGDLVPYKSTKTLEGYYRISPLTMLKAGEYGFVQQGTGNGQRVYTFGVD